MSDHWTEYPSNDQHRDLLNILMDSNFYFDLSLNERRTLLKHIVESYRSPSPSAQTESIRIEKSADPLQPLDH